VMLVPEERVRYVDREEEDAVDHGAEHRPATGLIDAENAGRGRRRIGGIGWEESRRDGRVVGAGGAGDEGIAVVVD
jgi:hypothetical protein